MTKHAVITGANRGIGLSLAKQLLAAGYRVTAVVRQASEELQALNINVIDQIDVCDANSVANLQQALANQPIDLLINNAGIFHNETLANMDFDSIERQLAVNAVAPVRVTHALVANLVEGAKVAMITSRMGSIEDNTSGAYIGYRMSKAALNAASKSMAIELANKGIALAILHPGFVQTRMVGFAGDVTPEVAAQGLLARISDLTLATSGGFWHANGERLPW